MTRDWRISNTLDDIEAQRDADPNYTLYQAMSYAKLQGFREDELWKISHLIGLLEELDGESNPDSQ